MSVQHAEQADQDAEGVRSASRLALLTALGESNFRWFWVGLLAFGLALEMQRFMLPWLVFEMSGSKAAVGLVGLCIGIPNTLFSPLGGVLADQMGRRLLIRLTQSFAAALAIAMALLLLSGTVQVWQVLVFALLSGLFSAFDQPSRQAIVPRLVPQAVLMNAVALNSAAWQLARIGGPAVAGVLLAMFLGNGVGAGGVFLVIAAGFCFMAFCSTRIRLHESTRPLGKDSILGELSEGVRFIASRPTIRTLVLIVLANSLFGSSFVLLMPVFAKETYRVGEQGLGLLVSSYGAGALLGTTVLALLGGARRRGLMLLATSTLFGLLLIAFAGSTSVLLSVPLLLAAGTMNSWYLASANTLLQLNVPDNMRGRVMGIYSLAWNFVPMGAAFSGTLAELLGASAAVAIGGLIVAGCSLMAALRVPGLRKLD